MISVMGARSVSWPAGRRRDRAGRGQWGTVPGWVRCMRVAAVAEIAASIA